ncbi:HAMP domain-containing histidine kinase [Fulvivirgaceae bacterium PWU5]|uniref:histidine kinase n=1 Tax=Dawidia cretensis TaxID=2782350 RepID=A0AAP2GS05_9BACT|nr:HAMP domain-containing sensor histidine kinase [Dawidia cretensis]MBT1706708.1 HAMP domain-containing histidine kinase [Dawidia cretensis]
MRNSTIRLIVILATLSIVGITITQIYWVRRAFNLKEAEFERSVTTALYNVAQQVYDINNTPAPAINPVKQLSSNYFVVSVNNQLDARLLEFLLRTEFERRNIIIDFEYGVYDCLSECMLYGNYIPLKTAKSKITDRNLPEWANHGYYFGVQFPNRGAHLLNQMGIWSFSTAVLLVVLIFFSYTIFIILKQKRLSEIQKDFINNMTHEFKTPISTIALSTQVLKDPGIVHQPERLLNYASIIEKENLRLKQQVERVLQVARLDKGDIALQKETVNVHQIIGDAIHNASMTLREKQGAVSTAFHATIHELQADRLHITNVLTNLLDNAIKYCRDIPLITVSTTDYNKGVLIEVQDNGIGIGHENHKRVFQKFYRVPTGNVHDVKGFGLGLSYVKTIVEAHDGYVTLHSELDKGSVFRVFIPA